MSVNTTIGNDRKAVAILLLAVSLTHSHLDFTKLTLPLDLILHIQFNPRSPRLDELLNLRLELRLHELRIVDRAYTGDGNAGVAAASPVP